MTLDPRAPRPFAKLLDIDGQQVLFELLPSEDPANRHQGIPDPKISVDLGWTRFEARSHLAVTDKGRQADVDLHAHLLADFTVEKARGALEGARREWGGEAVAARMAEQGQSLDPQEREELLAPPASVFAKVLEVDGRQVVVTSAHDLGENEDEAGLVAHVGQAGDAVATVALPGATLETFDAVAARGAISRADAAANASPRRRR